MRSSGTPCDPLGYRGAPLARARVRGSCRPRRPRRGRGGRRHAM